MFVFRFLTHFIILSCSCFGIVMSCQNRVDTNMIRKHKLLALKRRGKERERETERKRENEKEREKEIGHGS